jgi:biopolymer transport protein ExbD
MAYFGLPVPAASGSPEAINRIVLTPQNKILWNGQEIAPAALRATLEQVANLVPQPRLEFAPEADVGYAFSAMVLGLINGADVAGMHFIDSEKHRVFAAASPGAASRP